jgi:NTE family protein
LIAKKLLIITITLLFCIKAQAQQKVGLVLSGGGAAGMAHIGVLKALEENNIPIDYITGTSAGALVGSLYAAGLSPAEIEAYVLSEDFQLMASGENRPEQHFLLREKDVNSSMISLSFAQDSLIQKSLPTNFISTSFLDFEMMKLLGATSANYYKNFDSLFVPIRCVASDIASKKSVVFKDGDLNAAIRASMTFPFFMKPIKINEVLYFDGGLYNNFPSDIMYEDFNPDYIIGSNVSYNANPPEQDDLIGQLTNMLVSYTDFNLPCEQGLIILPKTDVATFNFKEAQQAIQDGYNATIKSIDSLKLYIKNSRTIEELTESREKFRSKIAPLNVVDIKTTSDRKNLKYTRLAMIKRSKFERVSQEDLEKRYYRLYSSPQIDFIFPTLSLVDDSSYVLNMRVKKSKEFILDVGGHLSSRPVNTGYAGLTYQTIGRVITQTKFESYFGKFYGSGKASFKLDLPAVYPISTSIYFTLNNWDYFKSFATFFEEVKPSFLVQNEMYTGLRLDLPFGNTVLSSFDGRIFKLEDQYYQTDNFTNTDTSDVTNFNGYSLSWMVTQNSLNRKQFASSGHLFKFKARYVSGEEHTTPGSTSTTDNEVRQSHEWLNLSIDYQSYVIDKNVYHLGMHGQLVYNTQSLFANYTATILPMTEFSLIPDAKTYFLPEYRSPQYIGLGINNVFTIKKNIDLRIDGYFYQPFIQVIKNDDGTLTLSKPFKGETYMASASAIYHSFIGPVRFTFNYFPKQTNPYSLQLSLGYVLFNERAIR